MSNYRQGYNDALQDLWDRIKDIGVKNKFMYAICKNMQEINRIKAESEGCKIETTIIAEKHYDRTTHNT